MGGLIAGFAGGFIAFCVLVAVVMWACGTSDA
jgi:hypothetical protein